MIDVIQNTLIDVQQKNAYRDDELIGLEFEIVAHSLSNDKDTNDKTPTVATKQSFDSAESEESVHDEKQNQSPRLIVKEGPFLFERLYEYGKYQMKLKRDLEIIQKLKLNQREIIFRLALEMKQRKLREGYYLTSQQQTVKRLHDTYSQKKNEEGRKLRMEIEARRKLREMEKRLWN